MYFITGVTGLVGSTMVKALALQGKKVKVLHRPESDLNLLDELNGDIVKVEGYLNDFHLLKEELKGVDTIIHAAALVSFEKKDHNDIYDTNVEGTACIVNAALESNIKNFIHISSVAAIGRTKKDNIINENSQWAESSLNSVYGKSKYLGELEVWRGFEEGLKGFILNPSIILGKGDWNKSSARLMKFIYEHHSHYPEGTLNYVDLRDVRDIILKLLDKNIKGERYILNGGTCTYKELFEYTSTIMNITSIRKPISNTKLALLQRVEAIKAFITGKKALITPETVKNLQYSFTYDSSKIRKEVDHEFRDLKHTLQDIVPYYIENITFNQ